MSDKTPQGNDEVPTARKNPSATGRSLDDRGREYSARTVYEAVNVACAELGIRREDLTYEIRDSGLLNILGMESALATIVVHTETVTNAKRVVSSGMVRQQRPVTRHPTHIGELDPRVVEEAAYRFHIPQSSVRQKFQRGDLVYDPISRRLVGAFDSQSSTQRSQPADSFAQTSERLPRGYWVKTDRMILRLQKGERDLLWPIVDRLEPIVRAVVSKVRESSATLGLEEEDLLQIGRIESTGLLYSYDPRSETRIYVYMRQWLYYRILRVVDRSLPIRIPANFADPDLERRAAFFRFPTTYEHVVEIPEDTFVGEEVGFEETLSEDLYHRVVTSARLSERQRYVLEHRYGLNGRRERTLEQVGADLGVTRERVRQLQLDAIKMIKVHIYLSFGFDTGLDFSTGKWNLPKVVPAVLHGDFSLGELPEQERSISAVQEWAVPLLP